MNSHTQPHSKEEDRLLDFAEVAHLLGGISVRSVYRLIAKHDLPDPVKVLSSPRLYASDVSNYLQNLKNQRRQSN